MIDEPTAPTADPLARIARLAGRVIGDVRDLASAIDAYRAAQDEIARLEAELADAKARLCPTGAQAIREWAAEAGVPCPARGRIPAMVVRRYEEAKK